MIPFILPFKINNQDIPHDGIDYLPVRYKKALENVDYVYIAIEQNKKITVSRYPLILDDDKGFWYNYLSSDFDYLSVGRDPFVTVGEARVFWDYEDEWMTTLVIYPKDKFIEWIEDNF